MLRHRPHMHGNSPVRFDHSFPNLRKDDLTIRSNKVIVTFSHVRPNYINMKKCLPDKFFHSLNC